MLRDRPIGFLLLFFFFFFFFFHFGFRGILLGSLQPKKDAADSNRDASDSQRCLELFSTPHPHPLPPHTHNRKKNWKSASPKHPKISLKIREWPLIKSWLLLFTNEAIALIKQFYFTLFFLMIVIIQPAHHATNSPLFAPRFYEEPPPLAPSHLSKKKKNFKRQKKIRSIGLLTPPPSRLDPFLGCSPFVIVVFFSIFQFNMISI